MIVKLEMTQNQDKQKKKVRHIKWEQQQNNKTLDNGVITLQRTAASSAYCTDHIFNPDYVVFQAYILLARTYQCTITMKGANAVQCSRSTTSPVFRNRL